MSSVGTRALFARSPDGKPLIPLSDPSVYAFGCLIRATEDAFLKLFGRSGIVAAVVGDGTLGEGMLYESMNLASIWQLPVLFVVENNGIAQTTPTALTIGGTIDARGNAFGLRVWRLNDADSDFLTAAENVVKSVRESCRPGFLIIDTMRLGPHSKGDDLRDATEMAAIRQRDPLTRIGERLSPGERVEIDAAVKEYLSETTEAAKQSPESHFERP